MKIKDSVAGILVLGLMWASVSIAMAQSDAIDPEFKKYIVHSVDRRSMPETLLNGFGLTTHDVGRSFALIVGVSRYPRMQQKEYRYLAPADRDIDLLVAYLKNQQFFDEIVVLRDDAVSFDNLRYFLESYFPDQLQKYPKSRFLFAYSGHGMTEGNSGYLLTSSATSLKDKQHSIDMFAVHGFSKHTIDAAYQSLFLINACHSGAFLGTSREGPWDMLLNRPGAHAIMSSGAADSSFGEADKGSFFYQKLIDGLNGAADPRGKGVITVADLGTYLHDEVGLATGGKQVPTLPQDIWSGVSDGGMFFFNRQKAIRIADLPVWNPKSVLTLGSEDLSEAEELWRTGDYSAELTLLQNLSSNGNPRATAELGELYELGPKGVTKDEARAVKLFQQAADVGDTRGMTYLGVAYKNGMGGLIEDDARAVKLFQQAADAGDARGTFYLGLAYQFGKGGLAMDETRAVKLYQQAADAGDARGMAYLGVAYGNGMGGLAMDEVRAVKILQQAANAGDGLGMAYLGWAYEVGLGGLTKDEARAVKLYQQAADAGDTRGTAYLGVAYERGLGGLTKDEARAVRLYQQANDAGDQIGTVHLGEAYEYGKGGLAKDEARAVALYRQAAAGNIPSAIQALKRLGVK